MQGSQGLFQRLLLLHWTEGGAGAIFEAVPSFEGTELPPQDPACQNQEQPHLQIWASRPREGKGWLMLHSK